MGAIRGAVKSNVISEIEVFAAVGEEVVYPFSADVVERRAGDAALWKSFERVVCAMFRH